MGSFPRIRVAEHLIDLGERLRLRIPCERFECNLEARRRGNEALAVPEADPEKPCSYGIEPLFWLGIKLISSISAGSSDAGDSGLFSMRARARCSFSMMKRL